jgi:hypothetical protein
LFFEKREGRTIPTFFAVIHSFARLINVDSLNAMCLALS